MARRYSDIRRGAKLNAQLAAYAAYVNPATPRPSRIGTRGARGLNKVVYVAPFTAQVGTDELCAAKCKPESYTIISPAILGGTTKADVKDALGTNSLVSFPRFRASRVVFFQNASRVVTVKNSEITNAEYLKYTGNHYSCPFGATIDSDDEMEAFLDVKAALLTTFATSEVKRVSLSREFVGVESV